MKLKYIIDVFKEFCKERHAEDKKRNYNLLQEVYSRTELFNVSNIDNTSKGGINAWLEKNERKREVFLKAEVLKNLELPFENVFVQIDETCNTYIFIREFEPFVYTGTVYLVESGYKLNLPFTLRTDEGVICFSENVVKTLVGSSAFFGRMLRTEDIEKLIGMLSMTVYRTMDILGNLPKYAVASDKLRTSEYYPRKNNTTLKVVDRPIYYVLDKKEETNPNKLRKIKVLGRIEFTHAFSVRGHWRTLNSSSIGKDRNGEYKIKGFTWVKEHVKGNGELVKRVRILK